MRSTQQKSTESTPRELTPKQSQVIIALVYGSSVTEAANQAQVDRSTIYTWMKADAVFVAELKRERREHRDAVRARLGDLAAEAVSVLSELLKRGETPAPVRLKVAMCVLQAFGALEAQSIGPTDPETVERDRRHTEAIQRQSDFFDSQFP